MTASLDTQLADTRTQMKNLLDEAQGIVTAAMHENRDLTETERQRHDAIMGPPGEEGGLIGQCDQRAKDLEALIDRGNRVRSAEDSQRAAAVLSASAGSLSSGNSLLPADAAAAPAAFAMGATKPVIVPVQAKAHRLQPDMFESEAEAYAAGRWLCAALFGDDASRMWLREHGIPLATFNRQTVGTAADGGHLVPAPLERTVIQIMERYGIFRQDSERKPMSSETLDTVKRLTGLVASPVGEGVDLLANAGTKKTWERFQMVARKWATYTQVTSELNESAIINIAQDLAMEIGLAFAYSEDDAGFNGDGTGTYHQITGIQNALLAGSVVTAPAGQLDFASLTFAAFEAMIGTLPNVPGLMPKWYLHKSAWAISMQRLLNAAGGNTIAILERGARGGPDFEFLGYPGSWLNVGMKATDAGASATGAAYFGDLRMGTSFGDKRGITVEQSMHRHFEEDLTAIKGTERFDIKVHETGSASESGVICMLNFPAA